MQSRNHDISHGVMLSYMEVVLKNLGRFRIFCHLQYLQTEASEKKILRAENDSIKFTTKAMVGL
jgi:hypothetical protein